MLISKTFSLYDAPLIKRILDFGTLKCLDNSSVTFSFALPFSGGTVTRASKKPEEISLRSFLLEFGFTFTLIRMFNIEDQLQGNGAFQGQLDDPSYLHFLNK